MGGEESGREPSKPSLHGGQRDLFGKAVAVYYEPPKKQWCTAVASTTAPDAHPDTRTALTLVSSDRAKHTRDSLPSRSSPSTRP